MPLLPAGGVRRFVRRAIFYRGLSRGGAWLGVSAALWGFGRVRRFFGREPEVLGRAKIQRGGSMAIVTGRPLTGRQARRARRRGASAVSSAR
jgi:hypothetical protein